MKKPKLEDYLPTPQEKESMTPRERWLNRRAAESAYEFAAKRYMESFAPSGLFGQPDVSKVGRYEDLPDEI